MRSDGEFSALRRWTVLVLLALLAITTVAEIIDSVAFGGRYNTDPAFYGLVGGMVTGLFAAEAIGLWKGRNGDGDEKP